MRDELARLLQDPAYLNELLLHRLSVEAAKALEESGIAKREVVRRLGTSASQLYRLLDPSDASKSVGQMLALLHLLGREVDVVVRTSAHGPSKAQPRPVRRGAKACPTGGGTSLFDLRSPISHL